MKIFYVCLNKSRCDLTFVIGGHHCGWYWLIPEATPDGYHLLLTYFSNGSLLEHFSFPALRNVIKLMPMTWVFRCNENHSKYLPYIPVFILTITRQHRRLISVIDEMTEVEGGWGPSLGSHNNIEAYTGPWGSLATAPLLWTLPDEKQSSKMCFSKPKSAPVLKYISLLLDH